MKRGFLAVIAVLSSGFYAAAAYAAEINTNLPGAKYSVETGGPVALVANFYELAFIIAGILAFGAIVWGAIKRTLSAGNPSAISDSNQWITSALLGLVLLLGGYVILNTINPDFKNLTMPDMKEPMGLEFIPRSVKNCGDPPESSGICPDPLVCTPSKDGFQCLAVSLSTNYILNATVCEPSLILKKIKCRYAIRFPPDTYECYVNIESCQKLADKFNATGYTKGDAVWTNFNCGAVAAGDQERRCKSTLGY